MAGPDGHAPDAVALLEPLRRDPHRFSLFAALRLLERVGARSAASREARRPADEPCCSSSRRISSSLPATSPAVEPRHRRQAASRAAGLRRVRAERRPALAPDRVRVRTAPTPRRSRRQRLHQPVPAPLDRLFYRAWADSDPAASHDRADDERSRAYSVRSSASLQRGGGRTGRRPGLREAVPRRRHRAARSRPKACSLSSADYFGLPIEIRQFVGGWLRIPADCAHPPGRARRVGGARRAATLGSSSWQRQKHSRSRSGRCRSRPSSISCRDRARSRTGGADPVLHDDEWGWQVRLLVAEHDVPGDALGAGRPARMDELARRKPGVADGRRAHGAVLPRCSSAQRDRSTINDKERMVEKSHG